MWKDLKAAVPRKTMETTTDTREGKASQGNTEKVQEHISTKGGEKGETMEPNQKRESQPLNLTPKTTNSTTKRSTATRNPGESRGITEADTQMEAVRIATKRYTVTPPRGRGRGGGGIGRGRGDSLRRTGGTPHRSPHRGRTPSEPTRNNSVERIRKLRRHEGVMKRRAKGVEVKKEIIANGEPESHEWPRKHEDGKNESEPIEIRDHRNETEPSVPKLNNTSHKVNFFVEDADPDDGWNDDETSPYKQRARTEEQNQRQEQEETKENGKESAGSAETEEGSTETERTHHNNPSKSNEETRITNKAASKQIATNKDKAQEDSNGHIDHKKGTDNQMNPDKDKLRDMSSSKQGTEIASEGDKEEMINPYKKALKQTVTIPAMIKRKNSGRYDIRVVLTKVKVKGSTEEEDAKVLRNVLATLLKKARLIDKSVVLNSWSSKVQAPTIKKEEELPYEMPGLRYYVNNPEKRKRKMYNGSNNGWRVNLSHNCERSEFKDHWDRNRPKQGDECKVFIKETPMQTEKYYEIGYFLNSGDRQCVDIITEGLKNELGI